jgi:hypothetical protein
MTSSKAKLKSSGHKHLLVLNHFGQKNYQTNVPAFPSGLMEYLSCGNSAMLTTQRRQYGHKFGLNTGGVCTVIPLLVVE